MAHAKHTRIKRAASEEQVARIHLLADLAERLSTQSDPRALRDEALTHVLELLGCASGAIFLWDSAGQPGLDGPAVGRAEDLDLENVISLGPVREVVLGSRLPLVVPDASLAFGGPFDGWKGLAAAPITSADRLLGLVLVGERRGGGHFRETDAAALAAAGKIIGAALDTSVAFAEFRQDMNRRMTEAMSQLSRALGELSSLKAFNEDLFESAPVGIIVFDADYEVTFRNSAADRLWPQDRSLWASARRTNLPQRDREWEAGLRDVLDMRQPWRAAGVSHEPPGDPPVRVNLTCSPLVSGKRGVIGGVLIVEDVTQAVQMEQRLAVSERLAALGRLAAMVAHEINNPLDGIMRLMNLARRTAGEGGDPRIDGYLAEAHKGLVRMVKIVRELLEFSRSTTASAEPRPIRSILAEAAQVMAPAAERAGVAIRVECAPDLPSLKSNMLYHVVLNLVKNAVEAMPEGGQVQVLGRCDENVLVIEVADTGAGIPEDVLPRLFQQFFICKAGGRGTGLGLLICKDLVEKQGGTITAANRPQGGACFTIRIPLAPGARGRGE